MKEKSLYCVYYIASDGECKYTVVYAEDTLDAILCAQAKLGEDYARTVSVYRLVNAFDL